MRSWPLLLALSAFSVSACADGDDAASDVSLESVFFPGSFRLSGSVTFASALPSGTRVQLNLTEVSDFMGGGLDSGDELANQPLSSSSNQVSWSIDKLGAGNFLVALSAELSGDEWIGEGDQGGYYGGTAAQPAQYRVDAAVIGVAGSLENLDFGAGPMQCKAHWGDPCAADDDCRGASCAYGSGLRTAAAAGSCTAGACAMPVATCDAFVGSSSPGALEESSCFNGP